jgi:hypothetical protein
MRDNSRLGSGLVATAIAAVALVGLVGCSGSDAGSTAASAAGASAGASASGAAASGSASARPGASPRPGHEGAGAPSTTHVLTQGQTATVGKYVFAAGTAATKKRFSRLSASLNGIPADVTYLKVSVRSESVADVAVYSFPPAQAKSALFRGQIVRQMVSAAAKSQKVSIDTVAGTQFATAGKSPVAVGSFDGNDAVVVLGRTGQNSLTLASGAAQAYQAR